MMEKAKKAFTRCSKKENQIFEKNNLSLTVRINVCEKMCLGHILIRSVGRDTSVRCFFAHSILSMHVEDFRSKIFLVLVKNSPR
jgi:hypothetical protein